MSQIYINLEKGQEFTGLIKINQLDTDGDIVDRKFKKSISLGNILVDHFKGVSLGEIEVNLDFDEKGELIQIEIYS